MIRLRYAQLRLIFALRLATPYFSNHFFFNGNWIWDVCSIKNLMHDQVLENFTKLSFLSVGLILLLQSEYCKYQFCLGAIWISHARFPIGAMEILSFTTVSWLSSDTLFCETDIKIFLCWDKGSRNKKLYTRRDPMSTWCCTNFMFELIIPLLLTLVQFLLLWVLYYCQLYCVNKSLPRLCGSHNINEWKTWIFQSQFATFYILLISIADTYVLLKI
jgi:hypothetical protein